jgi:hypothetical protein
MRSLTKGEQTPDPCVPTSQNALSSDKPGVIYIANKTLKYPGLMRPEMWTQYLESKYFSTRQYKFTAVISGTVPTWLVQLDRV